MHYFFFLPVALARMLSMLWWPWVVRMNILTLWQPLGRADSYPFFSQHDVNCGLLVNALKHCSCPSFLMYSEFLIKKIMKYSDVSTDTWIYFSDLLIWWVALADFSMSSLRRSIWLWHLTKAVGFFFELIW